MSNPNTNFVLVIDTNKRPLSPCKPGVARALLKAGKAVIFRRYLQLYLKKKLKVIFQSVN